MRVSSGLLLMLAAVCMLIALMFQSISVAGSDYRGVLLLALAFTAAADSCCAVVFRRGGPVRWVALVIALPTLFILLDFLRRAPYVWGFVPR